MFQNIVFVVSCHGCIRTPKLFALFILLFALFHSRSFSQNSQFIKGFVKDSTTKSNIAFATVTVFKAKDTSIINYRLSDPEGTFKVPDLPLNIPLRAIITHSGYKVIRLEFELKNDNPSIDFGVFYLKNDFTVLDEVLILAERPPVTVRNDTIEFNASSFKTLPNALVEDLLKKLPGVAVARDGSITVNGRTVNRILVDGKEFFGSDVRIATRNLPADLIDKVQVADDQQELDENLLADKSTVGKVINLKLRKGVKKGWFGKAYAGIGSSDRYEAGGIANLFRDTLQISLIGFSNNINKPGFGLDDIKDIGGFARSGYSSSMISSSGGIALDGISFGATSEGVQKSTGAGFNMNTELSPKQTLNIKYFYGSISSEFDRLNNVRQFLNDTIFETKGLFDKFTKDHTHRISASLKWKTSAFSNLTIRPSFSFGKKTIQTRSEMVSLHNFKGLLNQSESFNQEQNDYNTFNTDINYRRNFKKRGRSIAANANFYFSNNDGEFYTDINSFIYYGTGISHDIDQLRSRDLPNSRISVSGAYLEPISKTGTLQFSNNTIISRYEDRLNTFEKDQSSGKYSQINSLLSNNVVRNSYSNITTIGGAWVTKKLRISPKLGFQLLSIDNDFEKPNVADQRFTYLQPGLTVSWNGIFFNYFSGVTEPRIIDLQPVVDNTNPLYLRFGNPNLEPSSTQSIYLTYDKYKPKKLLTYRFLISSIFYDKAVIYQRLVDSFGVQYTSPLNVDGVYTYRGNLSLTKQIKKINKWDLSLTASLYSDYLRTKVIVNKETSSLNNFTLSPSIRYSWSFKDQFEINQEYSFRVNTGKYSNGFFTDNRITTHQLSSELILRSIKHLVIETSVDYYHNNSITTRFEQDVVLWNGAINILLFKNQRANLKFLVYDILNENKSINTYITENLITEEQTTTLKRFVMVSFTYNIRNVKVKKVGGKDKLLRF